MCWLVAENSAQGKAHGAWSCREGGSKLAPQGSKQIEWRGDFIWFGIRRWTLLFSIIKQVVVNLPQ